MYIEILVHSYLVCAIYHYHHYIIIFKNHYLSLLYMKVLMRALRDFNTPKIVTDDVPIFMGLIGDLFPALDVPRKRDMDFEACVKQSVLVRSKVYQLT